MLFQVKIHDINQEKIETQLTEWIQGTRGKVIMTPNAEMLLRARKDGAYKEILNAADLSLPDAVSLRYAVAALTDDHLTNRRTGVDTLEQLASLCHTQKKSLVLLGGHPESAERAAEQLRRRYPGLDVMGVDPGHLQYSNKQVRISQALVDSLERLEADVMAVALGMEKQEAFMLQAKHLLPDVNIWIGVGGALEMLAEQKQRAPLWLRKMGLEFLWRLALEPKRLPRILTASIQFPIVVAREAAKQKRLLKALPRVFSEVRNQLKTV